MITDIFMNMSDYRGKTIQYEEFVLPITAENNLCMNRTE